MPLVLVEMEPDDFARRRAGVVADYAEAIAPARGLTPAEARAQAARDIAERLPHGAATRGHLFRKAVADGREVGWIWVSLPDALRSTMAWIDNVEVDPEHRRRGHAAAIITAMEAELVALGAPRLGLNVFGDNSTARRLYERLGFEVTARQLGRDLDAVAVPEGIRLVPMADYASRIAELFAEYAQDLVHEQGLWHGAAERQAADKLAELLPQGAETSGMFLRTVVAAGVPVGWIWAGPPPRPRPGQGWLHAIEIDEGHRNRGYGSAAVAAVEAELVRQGLRSMGLNVHGLNTDAARLYQRLGYRLLTQQMIKDLPAR
jgi:ribosomal protein S18 acetylase RimI-like enzyme